MMTTLERQQSWASAASAVLAREEWRLRILYARWYRSLIQDMPTTRTRRAALARIRSAIPSIPYVGPCRRRACRHARAA